MPISFRRRRANGGLEWAGYERILGKFAWLYNFAEANGYVIE